MRFSFTIIETLEKKVEVEAEDYTEAKNEIERKYYDGEIVLTADNRTNTEFELII